VVDRLGVGLVEVERHVLERRVRRDEIDRLPLDDLVAQHVHEAAPLEAGAHPAGRLARLGRDRPDLLVVVAGGVGDRGILGDAFEDEVLLERPSRARQNGLPQFVDVPTDGVVVETAAAQLEDRSFEFAAGRNFQHKSAEQGYFEAVLGAVAARELGASLGTVLHPAHGDPEGHSHTQGFTVVGILKRSGTSNDRAVFVNMEGFYLMTDHAKPVDEHAEEDEDAKETHEHAEDAKHEAATTPRSDKPAEGAAAKDAGHDEHAEEGHAGEGHAHEGHAHDHVAAGPIPMNQREVTAVLIRTVDPAVTPGLQNMINEGREAQAVLPVLEIYNLFEAIVRPIQTVLLVLTAMICVVSGISILVSIYNSMSERRHEIAVMRALGAGRDTVMTIILLESVLLSLGGGLAGWLIAHALNALAAPLIAGQTGVAIRFWDIELSEALLIPAILLLAIAFGFFPAVSAYRTDVGKSL